MIRVDTTFPVYGQGSNAIGTNTFLRMTLPTPKYKYAKKILNQTNLRIHQYRQYINAFHHRKRQLMGKIHQRYL